MAIDEEVVRLAELRNNLVTVEDLHSLGLSDRQIGTRRSGARLFPVHRGVLSLRPPPFDFETRAIAACLAWPAAVLSFSTAGFLLRIRRVPREWLDLTVTNRWRPPLTDAHVHHTNQLHDEDVLHWLNGMRLTTPARTLFDLASVLDGPALCSAVEDCRNRNLVSAEELDVIASRLVQRGRPGSVLFRSIAKPLLDAAPSESGYEVTVRRALCETGLSPTPQYPLRLPNGRQIRLDLALVESRIDVELDPAPTHAAPTAVAADKARDVQVALAGWQTLRFSEDDIDHRLRSLVGYVRALHLQRQAA